MGFVLKDKRNVLSGEGERESAELAVCNENGGF